MERIGVHRRLSKILNSNRISKTKEHTATPANAELPADGIYYFSSEMDELRIDGKVIISNDGKLIRHSRTRNSIALQKGKHAFQLLMINNNIGGYLRTWNNKGFILAPEGNELELPKPEKLTH